MPTKNGEVRTLPGRPTRSSESGIFHEPGQPSEPSASPHASQVEASAETVSAGPGPVQNPGTDLWSRRLLGRLIDVFAVVLVFLALYHSGRDVLMSKPGACDPAPAPNCNVLSETERLGTAGETIIEYRMIDGRVIDLEHGTYQVLDTVYIADPPEISTYLVTLAYALMALVLLPGLVGWSPGKLIAGLRLADQSGRPASLRRTLMRWGLPDGLLGLVGVAAAATGAPWPLRLLVILIPTGVGRAGLEAQTLLSGSAGGRSFAAAKLGPLSDAGLNLVVVDRAHFRLTETDPADPTGPPTDQRSSQDLNQTPTPTPTPPSSRREPADDTLETWAGTTPNPDTTDAPRQLVHAEPNPPDQAIAPDPPLAAGPPRLFSSAPRSGDPVAPAASPAVQFPPPAADPTPVGWTPFNTPADSPPTAEPPPAAEPSPAAKSTVSDQPTVGESAVLKQPAVAEKPDPVSVSLPTDESAPEVPETPAVAGSKIYDDAAADPATDLATDTAALSLPSTIDHVVQPPPQEDIVPTADPADPADPAGPGEATSETTGDAGEQDPYTPHWNQARQAYICWEPQVQEWLQWNDAEQIWVPITR